MKARLTNLPACRDRKQSNILQGSLLKKKIQENNLYLARARRFVRNLTRSADNGSQKPDAATESGDFEVVLLNPKGFLFFLAAYSRLSI
jgi:hypothetical protein